MHLKSIRYPLVVQFVANPGIDIALMISSGSDKRLSCLTSGDILEVQVLTAAEMDGVAKLYSDFLRALLFFSQCMFH